MPIYLAIIFLFFYSLCFSQSKIQKLDIHTSQIPSSVKYKGGLSDLIKWKDDTGIFIVILSETGRLVDKGKPMDEEIGSSYLYANCYLQKNIATENKWKISDFVKDCPFDITAAFVKGTLQITDLNANGIAEVWVMYKVTCRSDVSPSDMKIIMYEGDKKHAMRGQNKVPSGDNTFLGGDYKFDTAFNEAQKSIKDFAIKLWDANVIENWEK